MHDNITAFREAFNRIDNYLRKRGGYDTWKDFSSILKEQAGRDGNLRPYVDELDTMRELRNILVHQEGVYREPIANPSIATVKRLEAIYQELTNPPTVNGIMIQAVETTELTALLKPTLALMRERCYTILPVMDDARVVAVLSEYSLLKWCAGEIGDDGAVLEARTVGDIEKHLDAPDTHDINAAYQFVARNTPVSKIREIFQQSLKGSTRLNAIFVTQSGKPSEKLLGILTSWDVT